MAHRTYYAGNGRDLIGFDSAAARDTFVEENPRYMAETSRGLNARGYLNGYRDYPQWRKCAELHHMLIDRAGRVWIVNLTAI